MPSKDKDTHIFCSLTPNVCINCKYAVYICKGARLSPVMAVPTKLLLHMQRDRLIRMCAAEEVRG